MFRSPGLITALALAVTLAACGDSGTPPRVGFEILERRPDGTIKAWVNVGDINREQFAALELPATWIKNQVRESGGTGTGGITSRFLRSPDAAPGEYVVEQHFGYTWLHAATVVQIGVQLEGDPEGDLVAVRVRKYHEYTVEAGTPILALVSPSGEAYFRNGRDADRTVDDPTIPQGWRLVDYTPKEELIIELFDDTLVIRTDNQDSFQGAVPALFGLL